MRLFGLNKQGTFCVVMANSDSRSLFSNGKQIPRTPPEAIRKTITPPCRQPPSSSSLASLQRNIRQTASRVFKDYDNAGEHPCPISATNVFPLNYTANPTHSLWRDNFSHAVAATMLNKDIKSTDAVSVLTTNYPTPLTTAFHRPDIVVDFAHNDLKETVVSKMTELGLGLRIYSQSLHSCTMNLPIYNCISCKTFICGPTIGKQGRETYLRGRKLTAKSRQMTMEMHAKGSTKLH
jgi:hypothetical protein